MKIKKFLKRALRLSYNYLMFFFLTAFLVTSNMVLFLNTLRSTLDIALTEENVNAAAVYTFCNVLFLSLIFTVVDIIRRKITIGKITDHISDAAKEMVHGNFDVRIEPVTRLGADEKYNEIIKSFNTMATELQSVETLRTDFIANVSHEMKTPLSVIQNYGTLLQTPGLSEEKRLEYAKGITDNSRRMGDMMTNILKLNRLENQQFYPEPTEFDLGEQLCESLLQYEKIWEREGIDITTDIEDGVLIKADDELLSLVWSNLLSNAFKFTPSGGKITVSLKSEGKYAVVKIADTGCGMTSEVGAHIFEKFYQGDASHSLKGNGLGLALVKRVVDIMKAEISVESTLGKGSTFTVRVKKQ